MEPIINQRPIAPVSDDLNDFEARVSFLIKLQVQLYLKREFDTGVFL